eukprot:744-Heterococcus_DN1.PRE.8
MIQNQQLTVTDLLMLFLMGLTVAKSPAAGSAVFAVRGSGTASGSTNAELARVALLCKPYPSAQEGPHGRWSSSIINATLHAEQEQSAEAEEHKNRHSKNDRLSFRKFLGAQRFPTGVGVVAAAAATDVVAVR